jgi:hypothetical protein
MPKLLAAADAHLLGAGFSPTGPAHVPGSPSRWVVDQADLLYGRR